MEPNARYTLVGSVVLACFIGVALSIVWLSRSGSFGREHTYLIYLKEFSSAGLQRDGLVTMRGIKIGTVRDLSLSRRDASEVRVEIQVQPGTPIKTDTSAVVQRNLVTGLASIDLVNSSSNAPLLERVSRGERYPIIPEGKNELAELQSSLPKLANRSEELLLRLDLLLSDSNQEAVRKILDNLAKFSDQLGREDGDVVKMLHAITKLTSTWQIFIEEFNARSKRLLDNSIVLSETVNQDSTVLAKSVASASSKLSRAAEVIEDPKSALIGPNEQALGPGENR